MHDQGQSSRKFGLNRFLSAYHLSWQSLMLLLLITGCQKMCAVSRSDMSPEQVVEAYLNLALNMSEVSQKYELMEFTSGQLKDAISGATDETIKKAYIERKYKLLRFSLVERKDLTPKESHITFQISYKERLAENTQQTMDEAPQIMTENIVALNKEKGRWYIHDVLGNKTTVDFPVSPLD